MARMTIQKKILYEEVQKCKGFFDAQQLLEAGSKRHKKIGLATVYRMLNTLEKEGKIHSFICNNRKIYSIEKKNHIHFHCDRCNLVSHIEIKTADFLNHKSIAEVCHFQLDITGVCKKCMGL